VDTGIACHILPASGKGPRAKLGSARPVAVIKAPENGVWMCGYHGGLIDKDDGRFSVDTLVTYRDRATSKAQTRQTGSSRGVPLGLVSLKRRSTNLTSTTVDGRQLLSDEGRSEIQDFIDDSGVAEVWGRSAANAAFVFFGEIASNAVEHANLPNLTLESFANQISLIVDGDSFSLNDLESSPNPGGGADQLTFIRTSHAGLLTPSFRSISDGAQFILTGPVLAEVADGPCIVSLSGRNRLSEQDIAAFAGCSVVHIRVGDRMIRSDNRGLFEAIQEAQRVGARAIIHCRVDQEDLIWSMISTGPVERDGVILTR